MKLFSPAKSRFSTYQSGELAFQKLGRGIIGRKVKYSAIKEKKMK